MSTMLGIGVGYRSIDDVLPRNWQARLATFFVAQRIICEHYQGVKLEYTNFSKEGRERRGKGVGLKLTR